MTNNLDPDFKLRAEKPKPTQVNKPLVWGLIGIVLLFVVVVFVLALSQSGSSSPTASNDKNTQAILNDQFKQLPGSYSDRESLKKYLPDEESTANKALKQQLDQLQQEQAALQNQLKSLSTHPKNDTFSDQETKQATMSGLFFAGSNPQNNTVQKPAVPPAQQKSTGNQKSNNQNSYEKQNMQGQKIAFLKTISMDKKGIYNAHSVNKPASPYEVQAGSLISAVMMTAVNTSLPGEVVATVRQDLYNTVDGQFLLIPKGSKIIGQYDSQVSYGQERVLIVFNRLIRPDGSSIIIDNAPGADLFGQAGMEGSVDNHWGEVISAAVLSTTLSLGAGSAASNSFGGNTNAYYPNSAQGGLYGAANNISQVGQGITSRSLNVQPTLVIPAGYEFNIIVNKDMVLPPMGVE